MRKSISERHFNNDGQNTSHLDGSWSQLQKSGYCIQKIHSLRRNFIRWTKRQSTDKQEKRFEGKSVERQGRDDDRR